MIELIAGGARSGKSRYALKTAEKMPGNRIFIATASAGDEEMAERIARHQAERNSEWQLMECALYLTETIEQYGAGDVLLIDCLTLWLSNWLCSEQSAQWENEKNNFLVALKKSQADILIVTNEVGMGVVPAGSLSRQFVDQSGWLHQRVAEIADKVTLVIFGLNMELKKNNNF